jgi:hypothetical protein
MGRRVTGTRVARTLPTLSRSRCADGMTRVSSSCSATRATMTHAAPVWWTSPATWKARPTASRLRRLRTRLAPCGSTRTLPASRRLRLAASPVAPVASPGKVTLSAPLAERLGGPYLFPNRTERAHYSKRTLGTKCLYHTYNTDINIFNPIKSYSPVTSAYEGGGLRN